MEYDAATELAASYEISYFETSAKSNFNIDDSMKHIFQKTYDYKRDKLEILPVHRQSFALRNDYHSEVTRVSEIKGD